MPSCTQTTQVMDTFEALLRMQCVASVAAEALRALLTACTSARLRQGFLNLLPKALLLQSPYQTQATATTTLREKEALSWL